MSTIEGQAILAVMETCSLLVAGMAITIAVGTAIGCWFGVRCALRRAKRDIASVEHRRLKTRVEVLEWILRDVLGELGFEQRDTFNQAAVKVTEKGDHLERFMAVLERSGSYSGSSVLRLPFAKGRSSFLLERSLPQRVDDLDERFGRFECGHVYDTCSKCGAPREEAQDEAPVSEEGPERDSSSS